MSAIMLPARASIVLSLTLNPDIHYSSLYTVITSSNQKRERKVCVVWLYAKGYLYKLLCVSIVTKRDRSTSMSLYTTLISPVILMLL